MPNNEMQGWRQRRDWYLRWGKASNSERLGIIWREHRGLIGASLVALVAIGAWWSWSYVEAFGGWLDRYSETIRNLMLSAGVIGAGVGVWIAFRRSETDRLRQITDSFGKAVELLGHADISVRLGAIYALERIARQNRDEHWPIMETLSAYAREWSERAKQEADETEDLERSQLEQQSPAKSFVAAPADVQAVFTVLGRRRLDHERVRKSAPRRLNLSGANLTLVNPDPPPGREFSQALLSGANFSSADLEKANLDGADLFRANFDGAYLLGANLKAADLTLTSFIGTNLNEANLEESNLVAAGLVRARLFQANLQGADLGNAILRRANFQDAKLRKANLFGTDLRGTNFQNADLSDANLGVASLEKTNFEGANLTRADLRGSDLSTAKGLTQEQLNSALGDKDTKIPEGLTRPKHWWS